MVKRRFQESKNNFKGRFLESKNLSKKVSKEKIDSKREFFMNLANSITLSRIAITPLIGYSVLTSSYTLGLGLTVVAGLSDCF